MDFSTVKPTKVFFLPLQMYNKVVADTRVVQSLTQGNKGTMQRW